jgi:hypothetical protein
MDGEILRRGTSHPTSTISSGFIYQCSVVILTAPTGQTIYCKDSPTNSLAIDISEHQFAQQVSGILAEQTIGGPSARDS